MDRSHVLPSAGAGGGKCEATVSGSEVVGRDIPGWL